LINFVSNLPRDLRSGGFSAMNAAAQEALRKLATIHYVGPINPSIILRQKIVSKLLRTLGSQGDFVAFSKERLETIAEEVDLRCSPEARFDFFHGFTPWILTKPPRPYVAWSDCTFRDYIDVYHQRQLFQPADLERIEQGEAIWLRDAQCIGFSNAWGAQRAVDHYRLDVSRVHVVGSFGEIEMPARDQYTGAKQFAFVSTDFDAKGGPAVMSAIRKLRRRHADASLIIVGAQPTNGLNQPGVTVAGYLRKEVPDEYALFRRVLAGARALVHPTKSDISPLIVIEAGYFGCPVISANRFAVPEMVEHGVSGVLLDDLSATTVADAMVWMLENESSYQEMRRHARTRAANLFSKAAFESKIQALVAPLMA
jgi:glycosyltransferase involved in cell wall biosynthesis